MKNILIGIAMLVAVITPVTSANAYVYAGYRWGGSNPTVGVDTAGLNVTAWRNAATDAMNDWNNTGSRWRIVNYSPSKNTMSVYFDSGSRTLAYTRTYRTGVFSGDVYRATVAVNNARSFNPPNSSGFDLRTVLRHEIGHYLVLLHEDDFYTLMNSSLGAGEVKSVGSDERSGIRSIYGVR